MYLRYCLTVSENVTPTPFFPVYEDDVTMDWMRSFGPELVHR